MQFNKRDEFLLRLYDNLWDSIDRVEAGMWQFIGLYAAAFGLVVLAVRGELPKEVSGVFGTIISLWGINVAINAGKWFNRNLLFVVNIEKQFLHPEDLGRIMPTAYHKRRVHVLNELNGIHAAVFLATAIAVLYFTRNIWTLALLVVGLILTGRHWWVACKEVKDFIDQTEPDSR